MNNDNNKTIVQRFVEAHNRRELEQLGDFLAPSFKAHIAGVPQLLSRDDYLHGVELAHQAFSNLTFTIEDIDAEGDKVVARIHAQGKHTGEYMRITPTGKQVEFSGINIRHIVGGKIIEEWQVNDQFDLLRQLGSFPQFT